MPRPSTDVLATARCREPHERVGSAAYARSYASAQSLNVSGSIAGASDSGWVSTLMIRSKFVRGNLVEMNRLDTESSAMLFGAACCERLATASPARAFVELEPRRPRTAPAGTKHQH